MNGAFYIGATGLRSQEEAINVLANNIANINTQGFKRANVRFAEMMSAPSSELSGAWARNAGDGLSGVRHLKATTDFSQGDLRETGEPLDLAVEGEGFIEILGAEGRSLLWRGGSLTVNDAGLLAGPNGAPLKAMVSVPLGAEGLTIGRDGVVRAVLEAGESAVEIGRIDLVAVQNLGALSALGEGLYETEAPEDMISMVPDEDGAGRFVQGALEGSNVDLSEQMVMLLLMQRAFAADSQVVQAGDQLMAIANGLRR